jgi:hypothetical protein
MKILPFLLLFALAGCSNRESRDKQMSRQILQWVPMHTSLAAARQIMEQHQYACSVTSYDTIEQMTNGGGQNLIVESALWTTALSRHGQQEAVTNITHLKCESATSNITFRVLNGETEGFAISGPGL